MKRREKPTRQVERAWGGAPQPAGAVSNAERAGSYHAYRLEAEDALSAVSVRTNEWMNKKNHTNEDRCGPLKGNAECRESLLSKCREGNRTHHTNREM